MKEHVLFLFLKLPMSPREQSFQYVVFIRFTKWLCILWHC